MNSILAIFIFCIVLFLYLHIYYHLKKCDDLEVYEIQQPSKERLEEICDLRQPVIFDYDSQRFNDICSLQNISNQYGAFDIKIRNVKEEDDNTEMYVPIALNAAIHAFEGDKQSKFLSDNNQDFLEETSIIKNIRNNDSFFRPYMVSKCNYDVIFGSNKVETPFRYDLNYRNYYFVTQGEAIIKIAPPKSSRYLYTIYDYDNFEFRSPVNVWNVQQKYKPDFDKVKCLEIKLIPGNILFLPSYWWYSIKLTENTSLCSLKYRTYMNTLTISPTLLMHFLQRQNTKHTLAPIIHSKFEKPIKNKEILINSNTNNETKINESQT